MEIQPSPQQQQTLLALARTVITEGCNGQRITQAPDNTNDDALFQQTLATFVTLKKHGELRGCIGSLQATRTLVNDIVHNAYASAFYDNRFQPVTLDELSAIAIEISILSPMTLMPAQAEDELLAAIVPGKDGIFLKSAQHSATFLPQVWEQLPLAADFLSHLKTKAGLSDGEWPEDMRCFRYSCTKIKE